ncbi:hypothetical protein ARMSODRAFT_89348 [Armillaria solidipes]|uniref:Uncharacterized protein n=1 Tax=Armillaria solidipes TaxID=1076256 RepID=A0A2H3C1F2_9AGAR|nr:hypothetical protein ARMSODRAFT_89348 [Armillaria solidipes]
MERLFSQTVGSGAEKQTLYTCRSPASRSLYLLGWSSSPFLWRKRNEVKIQKSRLGRVIRMCVLAGSDLYIVTWASVSGRQNPTTIR